MDIYKAKVQALDSLILNLNKSLNKLSTLRLAAFIGSVIVIIFLANERLLLPLLFLAPICLVIFGLLLNHYNKQSKLKLDAVFLREINEAELARLSNDLEKLQTGQEFISQTHDYTSDFDLFGSHSLFQLINRTTTEAGRQLLADWFSAPAEKAVILERQEAVRELSLKLDWRQHFQAAGMRYENGKSDYKKLLEWIEKPAELLDKQSKYLFASFSLAVFSTLSTAYFIYGLANFLEDFSIRFVVPLAVSLFVNSRFLKTMNGMADTIIDNTHKNIQTLNGYNALIVAIESGQFNSGYLQRLQTTFNGPEYSAAVEIERLRKILDVFQNRGTRKSLGKNDFYTIFNKLWLLDVHWILRTEKWKLKNRNYLRHWASAVSEFEVLNSIAGFAYSNPSFTFPEILEEPYMIRFSQLGHPLIKQNKRVHNDFTLDGRGEIAMITGSNMAGKSTFLRTVGLNLVLALMGAPCCAQSARVSYMKIFTSMRTQDNLGEGISSFYAELKRIERLLKLIETNEPIFFLLDEMFKGTNSEDRYKGGASLIRQLSDLNAFGIISTHDLELARLTAKNTSVVNFSFNSKIETGEIHFDYKLTNGICTDFNASELMKRSGIKIISGSDFN